jgi:hypothetical protein
MSESMEGKLQSEALMQKLSTAYKTIASPIHCPLCGDYPKEPITMIEPNKVIRCRSCQKDYVVKQTLEEKTVNQIMTAILQDFSGVVTEEIKNNLRQMITFYHQNLVDEMQKTLQKQSALTAFEIQNAYNAVDQRITLILENIQAMGHDLKSEMKQLSKQQEALIDKSQEQYQVLLQQTQLIVNLIKQMNTSDFKGKSIQLIEDKPKRKLKHTDFNPEEFAPI